MLDGQTDTRTDIELLSEPKTLSGHWAEEQGEEDTFQEKRLITRP